LVISGKLQQSNGQIVQQKLAEINAEKNELYTPKEAFEEIRSFIPPNKLVWEPFVSGNYKHIKSTQYLRELGFKVKSTNEDFFTCNYGDIVAPHIIIISTIALFILCLISVSSIVFFIFTMCNAILYVFFT
jgi:hypothetical protein